MSDSLCAAPDNPKPPPGRVSARRRWPLRVGLALIFLVVALAAAVLIAPPHVARYLLASELDALGIAHEGLDTIEVDLLRGLVAVGPVALDTGRAAPAQLARFEAMVDLTALFAGRLVAEQVTVRGLELDVSRAENGGLTINGLLVAPPTGTAPGPGSLSSDLPVRGVELKSVAVTNSHARIQTPWGGELDLALEQLAVKGFRSWLPEEPTRFELDAELNETALHGSGEVTPLLEEPTLRLDATLAEVTLERIARLTQPWKLARDSGRYSLTGSHELTLTRSGDLSWRSRGTLTLTGADYQVEELFEATGKHLEADFEAHYQRAQTPGWQLSGKADLRMEQITVGGSEQAHLGIRSVRLGLSEVEASRDAAGNGRLQLTSQLQAEETALQGQLRLSVEMVIGLLRALRFLAAGSQAQPPTSSLTSWADREVKLPASDVTIARMSSNGERLEIVTRENDVTWKHESVTKLTGVRVVAENQTTELDTLALVIPKLHLHSTPQSTSLKAAFSAEATAVKGKRQTGTATLEAMDAAVESGELEVTSSAVSLRLSGRAGVSQLRGTRTDLAATMELASGVAILNEASVAGTGGWKLDGALQAGSVKLKVGKPAAARAAATGIDVTGIKLEKSGHIVAESVELRGMDVAVRGSHADRELAAQGRSVSKPGETGTGGPPKPPAASSGAASATKKNAPASLERIQRALAERGFDPGPVDGLMGQRTRSAIKAFQVKAGLSADGRVSQSLVAALGLGGATAAKPKQPKQPIAYRIGRIAAAKGARLHFSDDTVEPDVDVIAVFQTLELRNLDTTDPDRRWQLRTSASVNELSRVQLSGWVAPLRDPPDLHLELVTNDLELSPFASYTDRYLGLSIEEGQLNTTSKLGLERGALDGLLDLDINRLQVKPMSDDDAEQIAQTLGVSASTAIALVKNAQERIELRIPIGGTLDAPEVDASDAVNKAIGGVVGALLPPNWIAALFSGGGDDVEFEPVIFAAGADALTDTGRQYLLQLAEAMRKHPDAVLTVCGRAGAADASAIQSSGVSADQVTSHGGALAVRRTRAVRRYLIQEQELPAKRVTECRATYSQNDSLPPRVEISL